jgi:hypothetical protein
MSLIAKEHSRQDEDEKKHSQLKDQIKTQKLIEKAIQKGNVTYQDISDFIINDDDVGLTKTTPMDHPTFNRYFREFIIASTPEAWVGVLPENHIKIADETLNKNKNNRFPKYNMIKNEIIEQLCGKEALLTLNYVKNKLEEREEEKKAEAKAAAEAEALKQNGGKRRRTMRKRPRHSTTTRRHKKHKRHTKGHKRHTKGRKKHTKGRRKHRKRRVTRRR